MHECFGGIIVFERRKKFVIVFKKTLILILGTAFAAVLNHLF